MTISTTTNKAVLAGNGAQTVFPFNFIIPVSGDEVVIVTSAAGIVTQLNNTQYAVAGFNNPLGGTVVYPLFGSPLPAGASITVARIVPLQQNVSFNNQGPFLPSAIEAALDNAEMQIQQISEAQSRALTFPISQSTTPTPLPPVAQRAGQILGFDSQGNPTAASPSSALIASPWQAVVASSTIAGGFAAMGPAAISFGAFAYQPLNSAGDTMTGDLTIAPAAGISSLTLAAAGAPIQVNATQSGVLHWQLLLDDPADSMAFSLRRYSAIGALIDAPIHVVWGTGAVSIPNAFAVAGPTTLSGGIIGGLNISGPIANSNAIQAGTATQTFTTGFTTLTFPVPFSAPPRSVVASVISSNNASTTSIQNITATSFQFGIGGIGGGTGTFSWIAIA